MFSCSYASAQARLEASLLPQAACDVSICKGNPATAPFLPQKDILSSLESTYFKVSTVQEKKWRLFSLYEHKSVIL